MTPKTFTTARLDVRDWRPDLNDPAKRALLEAELALLLTDRVLAHLPEAMQMSADARAIPKWVAARARESAVFAVRGIGDARLVGLLILAETPDPSGPRAYHLGYLFAETAWGRGYATELVLGLIAALTAQGPALLTGGVGKGHDASARVLSKAGFRKSADLSTPDTDIMIRSVP